MKIKFLAALAMALIGLTAVHVGTAPASTVGVRVVTWKGEILVDRQVPTGTTTVPTSNRATCFGGSPTDGSKILKGTTALGALHRATVGVPELRPLLLTNAFDFGIGVCAIGRYAPEGEEWWALKVNGVLATTGGDSTFLEPGDTALWYLDQSYSAPMPDELRLTAPEVVRQGAVVTARVQAVDGSGRSRPAPGARVFLGADLAGTADSTGRVAIRIRAASRLVARLPGHIPSNRLPIETRSASVGKSGR